MTPRKMTTIALLTSFLVVSAWISLPLPFTPVPLTLQSFMILALPLVAPLDVALGAYGLYLGLGLMGLPVFANFRSGFAVLIGPTGGYLLGFIFAQVFLGLSRFNLGVRLVFAHGIVYLFGVTWLAFILKISLTQAFLLGVLPYLLTDGIKVFMLMTIVPRLPKVQP